MVNGEPKTSYSIIHYFSIPISVIHEHFQHHYQEKS